MGTAGYLVHLPMLGGRSPRFSQWGHRAMGDQIISYFSREIQYTNFYGKFSNITYWQQIHVFLRSLSAGPKMHVPIWTRSEVLAR